MDVDGMTSWISSRSFHETTERLQDAVRQQGMSVFGRVDHGEAAAGAGLELRPLQVLVFGDMRADTTLMRTAPTIGLDLPLRAMVWTDGEGVIWLSYNDPSWLAARHGARTGNEQVLAKMRRALTAIAEFVTCPGGD